jgi:hypothetical protein
MPPATAVMLRETVQVALAAMLPPVMEIEFDPAVAVIVGVPQPALVKPFGVETASPAGSVSANATFVAATDALGLLIENVSEVDPLSGSEAAPNAFEIVGGCPTVIDAFDVFPLPPSVDVTETVLFFTPAVVP